MCSLLNSSDPGGLYVLLPPVPKSKGKETKQPQPTDPTIPPHLQHLVMTKMPLETCPWNLSGPQFPPPTAIQQRYCYPKGSHEYSRERGGALWTMYTNHGKEDTKFRLFHVYYSQKRAIAKIFEDVTGSAGSSGSSGGGGGGGGGGSSKGADKRHRSSEAVKTTKRHKGDGSKSTSKMASQQAQQQHHNLSHSHYYRQPFAYRPAAPFAGTADARFSFQQPSMLPPPSPVRTNGGLNATLVARSIQNPCSSGPVGASTGHGASVTGHTGTYLKIGTNESDTTGASSVTEPTSHTFSESGIFRAGSRDGDDLTFGLGSMSGLSNINFSASGGDGDRFSPVDIDNAVQNDLRRAEQYQHQQQRQQSLHQYRQPRPQQQQQPLIPSNLNSCQQLARLLELTHDAIREKIRSMHPSEQGAFLSIYSNWAQFLSQSPLGDLPGRSACQASQATGQQQEQQQTSGGPHSQQPCHHRQHPQSAAAAAQQHGHRSPLRPIKKEDEGKMCDTSRVKNFAAV